MLGNPTPRNYYKVKTSNNRVKKLKQSEKLITSKHLSNYAPTSQFLVMSLTLHHTQLHCSALMFVAFNSIYNSFYFVLNIL